MEAGQKVGGGGADGLRGGGGAGAGEIGRFHFVLTQHLSCFQRIVLASEGHSARQ